MDAMKADEEKKKEEDAASTSTSTTQNAKQVGRQMLMEETIDRAKIWEVKDSRRKIMDKKLAEMIVLDQQPFSITGNIGFQHLYVPYSLSTLCHHHNTWAGNLIPEMYEGAKKRVKERLQDMEYISLTMWSTSSGSNHSLMGLTGHWITGDFVRRKAVLNAFKFQGRHTAENIKNDRMLVDWEFQKEQVHTVLHDNAANSSMQ